jgi:hypothetical protein
MEVRGLATATTSLAGIALFVVCYLMTLAVTQIKISSRLAYTLNQL